MVSFQISVSRSFKEVGVGVVASHLLPGTNLFFINLEKRFCSRGQNMWPKKFTLINIVLKMKILRKLFSSKVKTV
uniref:Uncharacterized protein n=1 Tax=Strongyloides venezuelensis TaxID=75913 RepID=A0A0K0F9N2_STRVS